MIDYVKLTPLNFFYTSSFRLFFLLVSSLNNCSFISHLKCIRVTEKNIVMMNSDKKMAIVELPVNFEILVYHSGDRK